MEDLSKQALILCVLEIEDKTAILVLVFGVDVLVQVEQLLFNIMSYALHFRLRDLGHVRGLFTPVRGHTLRGQAQ